MQRACYIDYDDKKEQHNVSCLKISFSNQMSQLMHKKKMMILVNHLNHFWFEYHFNDALSHHWTAQFLCVSDNRKSLKISCFLLLILTHITLKKLSYFFIMTTSFIHSLCQKHIWSIIDLRNFIISIIFFLNFSIFLK